MTSMPVVCKTVEAAAFTLLGQRGKVCDGTLSKDSIVRVGKDGIYVHIDFQADTGCVILAFSGTESADIVTKDRHCGRDSVDWLQRLDSAAKVHAQLLDQFTSLVGEEGEDSPESLIEAALHLSRGFIPRRVLCTGFCMGGALATIAAVWVAARLPTADVRCITFGAPRVGNKDFAGLFARLVGNSYRVVYEHDPVPHHPHSIGNYKHVLGGVWLRSGDFLLENRKGMTVLVPSDQSLDKYIAALEKFSAAPIATLAHSAPPPAGLAPALEEAPPKQVQRAISKTRGLSSRCPTDYEIADVQTTLAQILLEGKVYQGSMLATAAYLPEDEFRKTTGLSEAVLLESTKLDTQVYVAWLPAGTAVFAFRGTESTKDALADADIRQRNIAFMESAFPGTRGHMGFMNQFLDVTNPDFPERHISIVLDRLSGGKTPTRVLCCGHSLGGALASLGAAWAAYQYPEADVRCVTLGSPRAGNKHFVEGVSYLVGTMHRLVHSWDPVPAVPPPMFFKHCHGCILLHKGKAAMKSRPWYMSYGLISGKIGHHMLTPYANGIKSVTGRDLTTERLGMIADADGDLTAAPATADAGEGVADATSQRAAPLNPADSAHLAPEARAAEASKLVGASPSTKPRSVPSGGLATSRSSGPVMCDIGVDPILDPFGQPIDDGMSEEFMLVPPPCMRNS